MDPETIGRVVSIIVTDLVLSGDNAVVIGMAARSLPPQQRKRAIVFGGGAAIGLRILFTILAGLLLRVPLLQLTGGLLLLWIAVKLMRHDEGGHNVREGRNMVDAMRVIVLADVVMSLDNMIAVAGVAGDELWLLLFGLLLSIPLLLVGSNQIAKLMNRMPWLVWIGALVLIFAAGQLIIEDEVVHDRIVVPYLHGIPTLEYLFPALLAVLVVGVAFFLNRRASGARDSHARGDEPAYLGSAAPAPFEEDPKTPRR